jgi:hypothetical protein
MNKNIFLIKSNLNEKIELFDDKNILTYEYDINK